MKQINRQDERFLYSSFLTLGNHTECKSFLKDLLTQNEFNIVVQRLKIAQLLLKGLTYSEISNETGASTATITRVSRSLNYGSGGLLSVLEKLQ